MQNNRHFTRDRRSGKTTFFYSVALGALCLQSGSAFAQSQAPVTSPQPNTPAASESETNDIVVTALRRSQTLNQAPAAITAVSGETLRAQQITNIESFSQKVPGLTTGTILGVTFINIRGVGLSGIVGGTQSPIGLYENGNYVGQSTPLDFLFMDSGSVEVLRGPQGTLYGRNATGGALNFTSAKPTDDFSGYVNLTAANYRTFKGEAAISGPIAEGVTARLFVTGQADNKGYLLNTITGRRMGDSSNYGGRASLRFQPDSDLTVDLSATYYHSRYDFAGFSSVTVPPATAPISPARISYDPRRPSLSTDPRVEQDDQAYNFSLDWTPSEAFGIEARAAYLNLEQTIDGQDGASNGQLVVIGNPNPLRNRTIEGELDIKGKLGGLKYIVGLTAARDKQFRLTDFTLYPPAASAAIAPAHSITISNMTTKSRSAFADLTFDVSDQVTFYGGARYSKDTVEGTFERQTVTNAGAIVPTCTPNPISRTISFDKVTGKVGAQYHFDRQNQTYVQFQQGYKAGSFNPGSCAAPFDPEKVDAFEIGYKGSAFDGALDFSLAAFHYSYTNQQVVQYFNRTSVVSNAGSSKISGAELEARLRASRALSFDMAVSWLPTAKYKEFLTSDPRRVALGQIQLAGNRIISAPRLTINLGAEYTFDVGGGDLKLRGEYYHHSSVYFRPFQLADERQDSYDVGNLFVSYEPHNANWSVRLFARNITDEIYQVAGASNDLYPNYAAVYSAPRSYGLTLGYKW